MKSDYGTDKKAWTVNELEEPLKIVISISVNISLNSIKELQNRMIEPCPYQ
jgi:hypothetical protein